MLVIPALLAVTAIVLAKEESMATLDVKIDGIKNGGPIPERFASCAQGGKEGGNISPPVSWSEGPGGTESYALIVVDKDVPSDFGRANKKGETIPAGLPRRDFYHWVRIDIPPNTTSLPENLDGEGYGISGRNDMKGKESGNGYDGPCPPWNDERLHHYHFKVYALNVPSLNLRDFDGRQAEEAMRGHILAQGEIVGTYTTNPDMRQ